MDVDTPLKTNMSLKRGPFQKESSLPTTIFRGHLSFRVSKFNLDDNAYMHIYIYAHPQSMGLTYVPTFTITLIPNVAGEYTTSMDPMVIPRPRERSRSPWKTKSVLHGPFPRGTVGRPVG